MKNKLISKCLTESSFYVFSYHNGGLLYNYGKGFILELTESIYQVVEKFQNEKLIIDEDIISTLQQEGVLTGKSGEVQDKVNHSIAYLSFAPVYACNFRCNYCFAKYGSNYTGSPDRFTKKDLEKTLDFFFWRRFPEMSQYRVDFVSGGEPLLGFEIIKMTIDYIKNFTQKTNKKVALWLCTNGYLLDNDICQYLSDNNVSIGISIDGTETEHNKNRVDASGKETYRRIVYNLQNLLNNPRLSRKFKDVWGLAVASNENCDFVQILMEFNRLGIKHAQIRLVRDNDSYNVNKITVEYERLHQFLYGEFCKGCFDYFYMILNDNDQYGKVLKRILLDELLVKRCDAGDNKITICPDGTLYPCDSFVGKDEFCMGKINDRCIKSSILNNIDVFSNKKCTNCNIKFLCGGDCYYNSLVSRGSIWETDDEFCVIQRFIIESCIALRYKMQSCNEELFKKLERGAKMKNEYSRYYG